MADTLKTDADDAWHALLFEAQSIQSYIFATNRLRDAVGGSELLDALTNPGTEDNLLDAVLRASSNGEPERKIRFSRRAGGAFYAFSQDQSVLQRFANLWLAAVQRWAPGLDFAIGLDSDNTIKGAFGAARAALRGRKPQPLLPLAAPVALRAQRTGLAASSRNDGKDGAIDLPTRRKKTFADVAKAGFIERFNTEGAQLTWRDWPTDFDPTEAADDLVQSEAPKEPGKWRRNPGVFPFRGDARTVAFIHGDGNGMGQALRVLARAAVDGSEYLDLFRRFSEALQNSAIGAARTATREVLLPARDADGSACLAARPLILGGDDLLVVVRADLALRYVCSFAAAFERQSALHLGQLHITGMPAAMSMGFGVVYVSADQPFSLAAQLAEALMGRAKQRAKQRAEQRGESAQCDGESGLAPSTVQFHRVTAALWNDAQSQLDAETGIVASNGDRYVHTLGCYALNASQAQTFDLPALDDLFALQHVLTEGNVAHGAMRGLLNALEIDATQAHEDYKRWREQMARRSAQALARFDASIARLSPSCDLRSLPYALSAVAQSAEKNIWHSPLGDALTLRAVGNRSKPEVLA